MSLRAWLAAFAALVTLTTTLPAAHAAQAMVNADVPAAKWKAIRLKSLPQGAKVGIQAESVEGGAFDLIFVHRDELKRFPAAVNPEFQGSVERKLSFAVTVSRQGDYYVIIDNRRGTEPRKVRLLIRAERAKPSAAPSVPAAPRKPDTDT